MTIKRKRLRFSINFADFTTRREWVRVWGGGMESNVCYVTSGNLDNNSKLKIFAFIKQNERKFDVFEICRGVSDIFFRVNYGAKVNKNRSDREFSNCLFQIWSFFYIFFVSEFVLYFEVWSKIQKWKCWRTKVFDRRHSGCICIIYWKT